MCPIQQSAIEVLNAFPGNWLDCQITSLGNHGGFSGANLWKIRSGEEEFCLRQWPSDTNQRQTIAWIHRILFGVVADGFPGDVLPIPLLDHQRNSFVESGQHVWELTRWLPGKADYAERPSQARIESIAKLLASFHQKCRLQGTRQTAGQDLRGVTQRRDLILSLNRGLLNQIENQLDRFPAPDLARELTLSYRRLQPLISERLAWISTQSYREQICIRDIWHDHVFFSRRKCQCYHRFWGHGF